MLKENKFGCAMCDSTFVVCELNVDIISICNCGNCGNCENQEADEIMNKHNVENLIEYYTDDI